VLTSHNQPLFAEACYPGSAGTFLAEYFLELLSLSTEEKYMKLRWWVVGIVAVAAGGMFMIKHLVDTKKTFFNFVDNNNEKSFSRVPNEILETEFDDTDFVA
jgi:hypothetical protein